MEPKSVKRSVSFPPEIAARADKAAERSHGGNLSRYLQALVKQDLESRFGSDIAFLTDKYLPARSVEMAAWLARAMQATEGRLNQSRLLAALLDALIDLPPEEAVTYQFRLGRQAALSAPDLTMPDVTGAPGVIVKAPRHHSAPAKSQSEETSERKFR